MSALVTCIFCLSIAFNAYYTAKRQGRWSWTQFGLVLCVLIIMPIAIVVPLFHLPYLGDKPVLGTLIAVTLIMAGVVALAWVLKKCWPPSSRPAPKAGGSEPL